uniref:uncharacterized protein LOC122609673 n=1 Tax=Erigeron canadensis TaxID=72917 RepID=UPI001CB9BA11|nr:uncharacterized protein LOC122609673 [Erigeron canadensis]
MQTQDSGLSLSFNCYSSNTLTSNAIAKVIHEEHAAARFQKVEKDFEFLVLSGEEETNLQRWTTFPVFDRGLLLDEEEEEEEVHHKNYVDGSVSITSSLQKLFFDDQEESASNSSEDDELENMSSKTFCLWRPKAESGTIPKCKKSSSTGSTGSKKWKIRCSFKRSNSEGKEPNIVLLTTTPNNNNNNKRTDSTTSPKQKRIFGKSLKAQTPVHELFYVQRRAENEMAKKKSYLPYRKDLVGLFSNVNGMSKMLPF